MSFPSQPGSEGRQFVSRFQGTIQIGGGGDWLVGVAPGGNRNAKTVAVCTYFPPKIHDGIRILPTQICSVVYRNNELRGRMRRATQMQQLRGLSILALLSGSLN